MTASQYNLFPNQEKASDKILAAFQDNEHVLLTALTQSGKTLCILGVSAKMMAGNMLDRVYFLCGANSNDLKTQARRDFEQRLRIYFPRAQVYVMFLKDIEKFNKKGSTLQLGRTLIILDESHIAIACNKQTKKDNQVPLLLRRSRLDRARAAARISHYGSANSRADQSRRKTPRAGPDQRPVPARAAASCR